jgi:hypothetical protein
MKRGGIGILSALKSAFLVAPAKKPDPLALFLGFYI